MLLAAVLQRGVTMRRVFRPARPQDNVDALELYANLAEEGRGCPRDRGKVGKCRDRAAHLRRRQAEMEIVPRGTTANTAQPGAARGAGSSATHAPAKSCCVVM